MTASTKTFRAELKAMDELGTFSAMVSTFGNVDRQGDRVMPGAFDKTIEAWRKSGDPIPVVFSHQWDDPFAHIGWVDPQDVFTNSKGFGFKNGHLDVAENPVAARVYTLMKRGTLKDMSFAYEVPPGGEQRNAEDGAYEIKDLNLFEVGPCLVGANGSAGVTGVKAEAPWTAEAVRELMTATDAKAGGVDTGAWDGAAAMASCSNAADYRKIAFERDDTSDPDTTAHWALPHHASPGADPNASGVSAALGALNGARGGAPSLKDEPAARAHLDAHEATINAQKDEGKAFVPEGFLDDDLPTFGAKAGRVLSKANEGKIRQASVLLSEVLASLPEEPAAQSANDGGKASAEPAEAKDEERDASLAKSEELTPDSLRAWAVARSV